MPFDKWGLKLFYPDKSGGFSYFQSDDILKDSTFSGEGHVTNSGGGVWTMSTSGPDAVQIGKNSTSASDIGGCNNNFDDNVKRGYAYKADDPRDIELKFLVKFVDSGSDNGFAIEGPTGPHSSSGCCSGYAYKLDIQYRPSQPKFRFRKEMWHVSNSDDPVNGQFTSDLANFQLLGHDSFVGIGYVRYNKKDGAQSGHNTNDSVVLEFWFNPDPDDDPTDWTMIKRTEDRGGWGNDGDKCNGDKDQIGVWSNMKFRLKSNDSSGEFQFKHLSLREIDPLADFDDNPTTPPPDDQPGSTTEVQGVFKTQWDINTIRNSQCAGTGTGGGGGSGNTKFYSVTATDDKELSDSSTFQHRTRIMEVVDNASSPIKGKTIIQVDVPLKKNGTPGASPVVHCKIWDSTGVVVYDSPTTFDPSTFTTSYVTKTFDFSTNTHAMVVGDSVGVEYTGTSSSNYVVVGYDGGDPVANSVYANYEGSYPLDEKGSRDVAMDLWQ